MFVGIARTKLILKGLDPSCFEKASEALAAPVEEAGESVAGQCIKHSDATCDEAQWPLALGADNLKPECLSEQLGPRDVP